MGNIGERFKEIRENLGFTQQSFGNLFNLSQDSISSIERGKNYNINLNWLIAGKGNKFINESHLKGNQNLEAIMHELEELKFRIEKIESVVLESEKKV